MELHQLRYVVAVAEEGSFTAAAQRELVAQPAVSAAVRTLERGLGGRLFRGGGGGGAGVPARAQRCAADGGGRRGAGARPCGAGRGLGGPRRRRRGDRADA